MRDEGSKNCELATQGGRTRLEAVDEGGMESQQLDVGSQEGSGVGGVLD
jgi:hypothetical protein